MCVCVHNWEHKGRLLKMCANTLRLVMNSNGFEKLQA